MTPLKRFLWTLLLASMWSPSFLFIKFAIQDFQPLTIASLRVSLAACILCGILVWKKRPLPLSFRFWGIMLVMAIFSSAIPFFLFCYAEKSIDSALAAILNGCTPMFTAFLAQLFVPSDRMDAQKGVGIALSAAGLVLLFTPNLLQGVSGTTLGMLAATAAAFSYAMSHVYGKLFTSGQPAFVAPAAQLILSSLLLWPLALWFDNPLSLPMPSYQAIGGVIGLAIMGTVCAFIIYYYLLEQCGPTAISMSACFFPVAGMLLGFVILGESMTLSGIFAASLILLGMVSVNKVIKLPFLTNESDLRLEKIK